MVKMNFYLKNTATVTLQRNWRKTD